ncbi:MAG TPA: cytochrome c biogenesis heme-transporting ATPase CcmA [Burkholderiales bacterium]|nr:cytochrome c biogenesis heme-transporting ATPase CcmA [Burkholderiales bacterium]
MLEARQLACMRGDRLLFSEIDLRLEAGGLLNVRGPNGSGKSSLLRMLCGLVLPEAGEITWQDQNIRNNEDYFRSLTYLGHLNGIKEELSGIENLRITCGLAGFDIDEDTAFGALERIGLEGREHLPAKVLSQGQRRRVMLARLLVAETPLWILDEPLVALDTDAIGFMRSLFELHLEKGGMMILTTHQELEIAAQTTREIRFQS